MKLSFLLPRVCPFDIATIAVFAFGTYFLLGGKLSAAKVFATATYLQTIRMTMTNLFAKGFQMTSECHLATKRLEAFFSIPDIPTSKQDAPDPVIATANDPSLYVCIKDASFTWKAQTSSKEDAFLKNIHLRIHKGELVGVCGPVGSGKSSLLLSILGEMKCLKGEFGQRNKNIAYASQTPWIISGTFKDNILFGKPYREEWFQEVVKACALDKDFAQLPDGEKTFISERGANLSGGQRARISLARAVYSNADIYLLDDPLSAVDAQVGKHLFKYCICGVLRKKAVLLATHLIQFVQKCDQVLVLENGRLISSGSFNQIASVHNSKFALHLKSYVSLERMDPAEFEHQDSSELTDSQEFRLSLAKRRTIKKVDSSEEIAKRQALLRKEEALMHGSVPTKTYIEYLRAGSGYTMLSFIILLLVIGQGSLIMTDWWLARWTSQRLQDQTQIQNLIVFVSLGLGTLLVSMVRAMAFFLLAIKASQALFKRMLKATFYSPIYFFQQNSQGRILNRFTKDVNALDEQLPQVFFDFIQRSFMILGTLTIASMVVPYVLVLLPFVFTAFMYFRASYISSSRQMKRMDAITRSPILTNFSVALEGLSTIRSYQVQDLFEKELCRVQNDNTRVYFSYSCTGRWLGVRLDILASTFFTIVVYVSLALSGWIQLTASSLGLLISYILQLIGLLQWTVRQSGEVENLMVSTERIIEYGTLKQEPKAGKVSFGENEWPVYGKINFKDLSMKYIGASDYTLKNISIEIPAGTRVGIVGRTGAGKSSFINALFRLSEPSHTDAIEIDDIKTSDIPIQELRSRLSIIPQEPFVFKGTLRENLDPFGRYSDEWIWTSLEMIEMKQKFMELPLKLDSELSDGTGTSWFT
jgi:ATP-binding cassette subfamily C (CFTR/MRP) protein 4